jgi:hypothetical protein
LNIEHDVTRLLELIMDSVLMLVKAERGFLIMNREGKLEVPGAGWLTCMTSTLFVASSVKTPDVAA